MNRKYVLNNGLKIISHTMPNKQSLALGIWIKAGGRYEDEHNKGISHVLEHLLFKGSSKYSCRQIKESIEGVGGALNGFTSEELTCYLVKIPKLYLKLAMDVLSDMVINPLFPEQEIEKEKQVILEEVKMYKDLPQSYVQELLDELLWPNQPLGTPIIGTVESVSKVKREDLSAYKESFYTPSNIVISAAGAFEPAFLNKQVKEIFSSLQKTTPNVFVPAKEEQAEAKLKVFTKETEQSHMALGFHSFKRDHPLKHALNLLHIILGANMSSRLFNEVREERGLAYEIGTQVKRFQDTGAFVVHAGIDNLKVTKAIEVILAELERIKVDLVTDDELKRAKEFYLGQLTLALEDTMDYMLWIGESVASLDKTYSLPQILKEVKSVSKEDIRKVAQTIFLKDKLSLALIGPLKDKEDELYAQIKKG